MAPLHEVRTVGMTLLLSGIDSFLHQQSFSKQKANGRGGKGEAHSRTLGKSLTAVALTLHKRDFLFPFLFSLSHLPLM